MKKKECRYCIYMQGYGNEGSCMCVKVLCKGDRTAETCKYYKEWVITGATDFVITCVRDAIGEYTEIVKTIIRMESKHSSTGFLHKLENSAKKDLLEFINEGVRIHK